MRYAKSRLEQSRRDLAYRIYVTDRLMAITGLKTRYIDIISPKPVEEMSADEIKANIFSGLAKIGGETS